MTITSPKRFIFDKKGRPYQLQVYDDGEILIAKLLFQGDEVGRIQCVFRPSGEMLIADLIIDSELVHSPENLWVRLRRIVFKPKPVNYRRRGLGSHLLKFAIDRAHKKGTTRICGVLKQEDVANTPNLASWYRKQGFQVDPPTDNDNSVVVARIFRDLK
ncbi:MAG: hypothetical protein NVS2B14_19840 [Chamaesiphon sp.]